MTFQQNQQFPNHQPFQPNQFPPQQQPFIPMPNQNPSFPNQPPIPPAQRSINITPLKPQTFGAKKKSSMGIFIIILIILNLLQTAFIVYENILPYIGIDVPRIFSNEEQLDNDKISQDNTDMPLAEVSPPATTPQDNVSDYSTYLEAFSKNIYAITAQGDLSIQRENEYEDSDGAKQISKITFSIDYKDKEIYTSNGQFEIQKNTDNIQYFEPDGSYFKINHENKEFIKASANTPEYTKLRSFLGIFDESLVLSNNIFSQNDPLLKLYQKMTSENADIIKIGENEFETNLTFTHYDPLMEKDVLIELTCRFSINPSNLLIEKIILSSNIDDVESLFQYKYDITDKLESQKQISEDYQNITNQILRIED